VYTQRPEPGLRDVWSTSICVTNSDYLTGREKVRGFWGHAKTSFGGDGVATYNKSMSG
jgi:hypothetical protein